MHRIPKPTKDRGEACVCLLVQ